MSTNPYAAPNLYAAPHFPVLHSPGRRRFPDLPTRRLRRLRNASHTIRSLGILWMLGSAGLIVFGLRAFAFRQRGGPVLLPLDGIGLALAFLAALAFGVGAWGALQRPAWGRSAGFALCILILLHFPIGTLIGALGLAAFLEGGPLFGTDALRHDELELEWLHRKRYKIP